MKQFRTGASRLLPMLSLGLALTSSLLLNGCSGDGDPVTTLTVVPDEVELGYGRFVDLDFQWQPTGEFGSAAGPVKVFVHLLADDGRLVRTFDHGLPDEWTPGRATSYPVRLYQSLLAPALAPGDYLLSAGLYDQGGQRWAIETASPAVARMEYEVARVSIPDRGADAPRLGFSQQWHPARPGADRQIVATRGLTSNGTIRLDRIERAGTLWLDFTVPMATLEAPRRFFDDATSETVELRLSFPCSGFESTMSGEGSFQVGIDVTPDRRAESTELTEPAEPTEPCELRFEANSFLELATDPAETDPLVLTLKQLAWQPAT